MHIKLLMIGDQSVGKTCLLLRYVNDSFPINVITTIGIDSKNKNIELDGKRIKLQVFIYTCIVLASGCCCYDCMNGVQYW